MTKTLASTSRPLPVNADELPSSFLILRYGENANANADAKGDPQPVFTRRAAAKIMADAARRGADWLLDLEHRSLLGKGGAADATDAMGWFRLELRPDGLYASQVRWTPEGARRLRGRLQRYTSPTFYFDRTSGEVTEFVNIALTSDPATYQAAPLVAASRAPAPRPLILSAVLSTKVPETTRLAFGLLAVAHKITPSELLRRLVERAPWLGPDRVATLARTPADLDTLLELLDLDRSATAVDIVAAVEVFLESLPAGVPASAAPDTPTDPTESAADAPKPAPLSRALAAKREAMTHVERDRFDRFRDSMARDRAAQQRPRAAGTRPPFTPAVRCQLAAMSSEQRQKFDAITSNWRK